MRKYLNAEHTTIIRPKLGEVDIFEIIDFGMDQWEEAVTENPDPYVPESTVPTSADVDVERDRRINAGIIFNGILFQSDAVSRNNANSYTLTLLSYLFGGSATVGDFYWHGGPNPFSWTTANNSVYVMDAYVMRDFINALNDHFAILTLSATRIKQLPGIPLDYTEDVHWT